MIRLNNRADARQQQATQQRLADESAVAQTALANEDELQQRQIARIETVRAAEQRANEETLREVTEISRAASAAFTVGSGRGGRSGSDRVTGRRRAELAAQNGDINRVLANNFRGLSLLGANG